MADPRGVVFLRVLSTIKLARPATFILENVKGLKTRHKETYACILDILQHIKDPDGKRAYKVRSKVLNSIEVGGPAEPVAYLYRRLEAHLGDSGILVAGAHRPETLEPSFRWRRGGGAPVDVRPLAPPQGQRRHWVDQPHQQAPGGSKRV